MSQFSALALNPLKGLKGLCLATVFRAAFSDKPPCATIFMSYLPARALVAKNPAPPLLQLFQWTQRLPQEKRSLDLMHPVADLRRRRASDMAQGVYSLDLRHPPCDLVLARTFFNGGA